MYHSLWLNMIVAVDAKTWGIGYKGKLLYHIPEDMVKFKLVTINQWHNSIVIMGRKTFESLPNQKPLKYRQNIVISSTMKKSEDSSYYVVNSTQKALELTEKLSVPEQELVTVIGGSRVYRAFMPYYDKIYITKVYNEEKEADTFIDNIDEDKRFRLSYESELLTSSNKMQYKFCEYIRK